MQKVLIIAYFYPPCNLTASARPAAWAKYLPQHGYQPIVITRNWDVPINKPEDISKAAGDKEKVVNTDAAQIYYLPYKATLKDKLYTKFGNNRFSLIRKTLSFFELFFQNFFLSALPFSNFYEKAVVLIGQNPDLNKVVITANPFVSFFIGYRLKRKFSHIQWVADYRDDWSTTELVTTRGFLSRILFSIESASEKKWVGTAATVTTISSYYLHKISAFTGVKGSVLLNGFSEEDGPPISPSEKANELVITYNGTLYPSQKIEVFLDGFKKAYDKFSKQLNLKLCFPGLAFDPSQSQRVLNYMKGYEACLEITARIPRSKVFEIQNRSHAFLMIAHNGIKGIPSSKLYEYLSFRKPVILCPNDGDIIEETLIDTGLGVICNSPEEVEVQITRMVADILKYGKVAIAAKEDRLMNYSRGSQAKVLAEILNTL